MMIVSLAGALLGGCKVPTHVVVQSLSPDGKHFAIIYEEEPRPLIQTDTDVYIEPVKRPLNKRADLVFHGGDMDGRNFSHMNIRWASNETLTLGYCTGHTEVYRNEWRDWRVNPDDQVTVDLIREASGAWPASTPPNRRSGTPPCT
jgi:hypothetical protein